ncbi:TIGR02266 family protein, partial [Corallococcus sicarius]|uniref:TIGR02266 family protein n=1 Tax=Corallococcus sicarius TaxID=2316726 RepID=UPI001FC9B63F
VTPAPEALPTAPRGSGEPYRAPDDASPESPLESPQRRGRRFAVKLELEFRTELDFVREHALNISNGGLFVRTAHRPPQDSVVTVDVKLPNGQRLQGDALVVHVVDAPYTGGVGLAFLSDDATFAGTLDGYLASLVGDKA